MMSIYFKGLYKASLCPLAWAVWPHAPLLANSLPEAIVEAETSSISEPPEIPEPVEPGAWPAARPDMPIAEERPELEQIPAVEPSLDEPVTAADSADYPDDMKPEAMLEPPDSLANDADPVPFEELQSEAPMPDHEGFDNYDESPRLYNDMGSFAYGRYEHMVPPSRSPSDSSITVYEIEMPVEGVTIEEEKKPRS